LPPGAASLAIVSFIRVPDQRQKAEGSPKLSTIINRLDPVGFVLFASACVEVLLALQLVGRAMLGILQLSLVSSLALELPS
jgi:hypothetical protein